MFPTTALVSLLAASTASGVLGATIELVKQRSTETVALPAHLNLVDYYSNNADLQWFGNITIGTPPQVFSVIFDTSSSGSRLAIPGTACTTSCSTKRKFSTNKSSTYKASGETSSFTRTTSLNTLPLTFNAYTLQLGGGSDVVNVAGVSARTDVWQITKESAKWSSMPFDGFLGLPYDGSGFLSQLPQGLSKLFTLYLTPWSVGRAALTLGSIDATKFTGPIRYASLSQVTPGWALTATAIYVNGKTTSTLKSREVIFDSSVSNVLAPLSVTQEIYGLISSKIQGLDFGMFGATCSDISNTPAQIDITFKDQAGQPFNLTIPSSELNQGPVAGAPWICQTVVTSYNDGPLIIGGPLLKNFFSVWDFGNSRLGFATRR